MRQQSLADEGFERYRKSTRRDQFLAEMEQIIPWRDLCKVIKPFYPKPKGAGRPPIGLERMLRIHCHRIAAMHNRQGHLCLETRRITPALSPQFLLLSQFQ